MARRNYQHTWGNLKKRGKLQERHVQMAIDLGFSPSSIVQDHAEAPDRGDLLLLEWVEDRFFAKHGHYSPVSDETPENQAEDPSEHTLLVDPFEALEQRYADEGIEEEDDVPFELTDEWLDLKERQTPVSYGEILAEDQRLLSRQENFRKAAQALADRLAAMPEVMQVRLFGSVALPLWKEVSYHRRLGQRKIYVFHECGNIDLAVWVTSPTNANLMRKACAQVVNDQNSNGVHLSIAHHSFSVHLLEESNNQYLGMVCHFNQCPKHKLECEVPGCGAHPFVQILPWFKLKPERLNEFNSQILFDRKV